MRKNDETEVPEPLTREELFLREMFGPTTAELEAEIKARKSR